MTKEATTPFCRFCRMARNERCSCTDHELCRDLYRMTEKFILLDRTLEKME